MRKYSGRPVELDEVVVTDGFWKKEQELVENTTIGAVYDRFEETGRFEALKCEWKEGMPGKPHIFWESDITKWIEGAAYFLSKKRDPVLEEKIDILVDRMERYQDEDGYLNVYFTVVEPGERFVRRTDHELYCAGHLIEGAIAYAKATGKTKMLDIAVKYIDLIDRVFRIEHSAAFDTPGHEEIELALVKLYRYTGKERYKLLAEYFLDMRGKSARDSTYDFADQEHMQSHLPVRDQKTAEGHCVRALYLYSAMADMAMLNSEDALAEACQALFENITEKRIYITGGIGSTYRGESFTFDYDLPEYTAYNETCASIALTMFCKRMWLIEADGKYADWAERALYNTVLGGISLAGDSFYYENPLAADPRRNRFNSSRAQGLREHLPILERVKVFDCSCCPPNLIRMIGSIGEYMYSSSGDTIYTQCYMSGDAGICLGDQLIRLSQRTEYPMDGRVEIEVETKGVFKLALRIPNWCSDHRIMVNGEQCSCDIWHSYAILDRSWEKGDRVELILKMDTLFVEANRDVVDVAGRVAVMRGPLVYCAEGIDNEDLPLRDIRLDPGALPALGTRVIAGRTLPSLVLEGTLRPEMQGLYRRYTRNREKISLTMIPYFAWANRGITEMNTWFLAD
ncbi:glycoside hydrolase family 127 protein [Butyrivibrio sp. MC2013]|uniref:glycoside hydrolase family 127 protein n=1 Tax=Butyrivibrio sp. MC2013 TaxID=1280686 RepID=UPI0018CBB1BF|nr:beta-L-arabinofuranosidase domain-containing protein [Butyrivibrio sp. MC2013]